MTGLRRGAFLLLAALGSLLLLATGSAGRRTLAGQPKTVEVVVALAAPPLARAVARRRSPAAVVTRRGRLSLRAPASVSYVRTLAAAQRSLQERIVEAIPSAQVRWRYRLVLNGFAVVVPESEVPRLASLPGVARVYPSVTYHALLDRSPELIGAPTLWGAGLSTAGNGIKIGIIDDGLDSSHPFFDPSGFTAPPGFPKGDTAYTTAKVIVARAFPPPSPQWKYAARPFDPDNSEHATHVAGIAAGDHGLVAPAAAGRPATTLLSGVAPNAYLGNYKALTIPTAAGVGLDGNSPEIAAAIEAAVADGMDVINLSLGEPEVEPSRDLVVEAIDAAADAGVIPVIAAGNDFGDFGRGSIGSPGTAPKAITAAAVTNSRGGPADVIASFSSSGPTPVSLQLKPDVSAPGVNVLSSVPRPDGLWAVFSGTSMATPHAAGAAALLRERHPTWTVAQIKSALVLTGDPVYADTGHTAEVPATREGGGLIDLGRADDPLVFADPVSLSLGLLRVGAAAARTIDLTDAGGGAGDWSVAVEPQGSVPGLSVTAPATVTVPGSLVLIATAGLDAAEQDATGFVVLARNGATRRIPYWLRVTAPKLGREPYGVLGRTGTYEGNTAGKPALVSSYRYPDNPSGSSIATDLRGPEQVFRVTLRRPLANFGVAVVAHDPGVRVEPRIVVAGDENRLAGYTALPLTLNPYLTTFERPVPVAGVVLPAPGRYSVVFDTPSAAAAGRFTFRFWIDDTEPPQVRLETTSVPRGGALRLSVVDDGSGVNPASLSAKVDGTARPVRFAAGSHAATIDLADLLPGPHRLVFQASDYQEAKNMEDVGSILPNTRKLAASFTIRAAAG